MEVKIDQLEARIDQMEVKIDQMEVKIDRMEVKIDQLEARIDRMEVKIDQLEARIDQMEVKIDQMEVKLNQVESDVRDMRLIIENEIRTNIQHVAEGHLDLSRNLHEALKVETGKEMLSIRVNMLETEMRKVKEHLQIA